MTRLTLSPFGALLRRTSHSRVARRARPGRGTCRFTWLTATCLIRLRVSASTVFVMSASHQDRSQSRRRLTLLVCMLGAVSASDKMPDKDERRRARSHEGDDGDDGFR
jgi:hypothetical protein